MIEIIDVETRKETEFVDITERIKKIVREKGTEEGICTLFVPHTTSGITINENADPAVTKDILKEINKIVPFDDHYNHMEGNSAAHIKASLFGFSETILVKDKSLMLGTWQGIYFCEFDGPRRRKVFVQVMG
jgi:secondary thiamine-phosphate synthase enzyme